jgi:hypothetical protein
MAKFEQKKESDEAPKGVIVFSSRPGDIILEGRKILSCNKSMRVTDEQAKWLVASFGDYIKVIEA